MEEWCFTEKVWQSFRVLKFLLIPHPHPPPENQLLISLISVVFRVLISLVSFHIFISFSSYADFVQQRFMCVCVCARACMLSCVLFFASPWTVAFEAPLSTWLPRQEYWSDLPFLSPGDLPRDSACISCTGRQILYYGATREAHDSMGSVNNGGRLQSRSTWQLFAPSSQCFCESNTALIKFKTKNLAIRKLNTSGIKVYFQN